MTGRQRPHPVFSVLGIVVSSLVQSGEIGIPHPLPRDVPPAETAALEGVHLGFVHAGGHGFFEIFQILVDHPVRSDVGRHLFGVPFVGDEFDPGGYVDAVNVGVADGRSGGDEVDVLGPGVAGHLYDFAGGGAAYDGVVDEEDVFAGELALDGVELEPDAFFSYFLSGHDEGAGDVSVFDESFAKGSAQLIGRLQGTGAGSVGNGYDDVDVVVGIDPIDLFGQGLSHPQPGFVDRDPVDDGIGSGKIYVFEDAGMQFWLGVTDPGVDVIVCVDKDGLAGIDVPDQVEAQGVDGDRFAGHDVVFGLAFCSRSVDDGPDAVGIAEAHQSVSVDEVNAREPPLAAVQDGFHGAEDAVGHVLVRVGVRLAGQTIREDVQQELGVRVRVGVPSEIVGAFLAELAGVGQVAVVRDADAVRVVRVQRLGLGAAAGAGRGIPDVPDADVAHQLHHVVRVEHVLHQTVLFAEVETGTTPAAAAGGRRAILLAGYHARGVLSAVLEDGHAVEQHLVHIGLLVGENDADRPTHFKNIFFKIFFGNYIEILW
mmetsp:Transcript_21921/g.49907  ORF Transcript_21921/g.49907 Transcript_21921/m.49907 type:complete len:540 (+) Transcript_21921:199-1818(+)